MARQRWDAFDEQAGDFESDFGIDTGPASKSEAAAMKRDARSKDALLQEIYEDGRKDGKAEARSTGGGRSRGHVSGSRRRLPKGATRPFEQGAGQAGRQLEAPVRRQVASGLRTIGLMLAVVGLYQFLNAAPAVSGTLNGVNRAIQWLQAPDKSVKFVKGA